MEDELLELSSIKRQKERDREGLGFVRERERERETGMIGNYKKILID
jgi:hypothetical protein